MTTTNIDQDHGRGETGRAAGRPGVDPERLQAFMGQVVSDLGAAVSGLLAHMGDRLGLYRALAERGPVTPGELAALTGTAERYVREWLNNQAAGGYVAYDPATGRYHLPPEQAQCLADESSPTFLLGGFESLAAVWASEKTLLGAFRTGRGVGWHEHDERLFSGTARFFRPGYVASLGHERLPALDGVVERLERGARVADVGCGHGFSTLMMARAFPRSTVVGFDAHDGSIQAARRIAAEEGLSGRARFEVGTAKTLPAGGWDFVTFFDCLHDMGDPEGALAHVREVLAPNGTVMLVEPFAHDRVEENLNPVGRAYYGFSATVCTPASLAQEVGLALGAQAGEARLRAIAERAGFTRFRRATETPFNLVLELRP